VVFSALPLNVMHSSGGGPVSMGLCSFPHTLDRFQCTSLPISFVCSWSLVQSVFTRGLHVPAAKLLDASCESLGFVCLILSYHIAVCARGTFPWLSCSAAEPGSLA
jgi:hypothetical protein